MSNTAGRIAELRRRIQSNKGKADRALRTKWELEQKIYECREQIRRDQSEIEEMGGRIRR